MAFIETIEPDDADGDLRREYDKATERTGHVWNIVRTMSPNPYAMKESMRLYVAAMHGPSPLSRAEREMLAVVVSQANDCHY